MNNSEKQETFSLSKKKRQLLRGIGFTFCLVILLTGFELFSKYTSYSDTFSYHFDRYEGFKKEEENTIDIVTFGTSTGNAWIPTYAWENYGITSYNLSSDCQPFCITKDLIENVVFDKQNPKIIIVDLGSARKDPSTFASVDMRELTENLSFPDRFKIINNILAVSKDNDELNQVDRFSYYFPSLWEHNFFYMFFDGKETEHFNEYKEFKGATSYSPFIRTVVQPKETKNTITPQNPGEIQISTLDEFLRFCDSHEEFKVIFTLMPKAGKMENSKTGNFDTERSELLYVVNYVREHGYEVLDFMDDEYFEKLSIDFDTDWRDIRHFNIRGSMKFTDYMCNYILAKYDIPDRTNDENLTKNWNNAANAYRAYFRDFGFEIPVKGYISDSPLNYSDYPQKISAVS